MDFGLIYELTVPEPVTPQAEYRKYWDCIEQVKLAEQMGFSHVWFVEHHFLRSFSHSSAPEVFLAALAQHTSTIRLCHGVVLLPHPFNHPVRVAERIAALDILSNGRVEFGTGRSITDQELGGFQIDPADSRPMWEEAVRLIPRYWTDGLVTHTGKYLQIPPREVFPKPVQRPHPPMWQACTSPASWAIAGSLGLGALGLTMANPPELIKTLIRDYRTALLTATPVGKFVNDNVGLFFMANCAATKNQSREISEHAFTAYMAKTLEFFLHWNSDTPQPGYEWYAEAARLRSGDSERRTWDYLYDHQMMLAGDPDHLCEVIQLYEQMGVNQIIMAPDVGAISHDDVMTSIKMIGTAVLPRFSRARLPV
jgi:alkanesulfonate monooxygenase SsuD/methylene tetrahydromethanopterin reductase-like flavin-dependent oxidoreductase (luciferase family)